MIQYNKNPFVLLLIPVVVGITWGNNFSFPSRNACAVIVGISVAGLLLSCYTRRVPSWLFPLFAWTLLFTVSLSRARAPGEEVMTGAVYRVEGECVEAMRYNSYLVRCRDYTLYLQASDTLPPLVTGDLLSFPARLFPLRRLADVHEFDHDQYLRQLDVRARAIPVGAIERTGHVNTPRALCQSARAALTGRLAVAVRDTSTRALLQALCLGDRSLVTPRVHTLFKESGTIHLLAVSGLHAGAVYLLLTYLLGLSRLPRRARVACVLPFLWAFAGITGLSPSAVRAAMILSFIIIGQLTGRDYRAVNALCASAFFTLLVSPYLLYSVSFQMSYAAYAGIVLLYPLLRVEWRNAFVARVYSLFALSIAAQAGVLPLVAYYFHEINVSSVLINIVLVPLASCLLYAGIVLLALPVVVASSLSFVVSWIYEVMIFSLEQYARVAVQWYALYPTVIHVLFFQALVLLVAVYPWGKRRGMPRVIGGTVVLLMLYHGTVVYRAARRAEVVIYNRRDAREVLLNYRGRYAFLARDDSAALAPAYVAANRLEALPANEGFVSGDVSFEEQRLVTPRVTLHVADRQHAFPGDADVVLVTGNLYPGNLSGEVSRVTRVIVDRSNDAACTRAWERWGASRGVTVEKTIERGPIVIPLE